VLPLGVGALTAALALGLRASGLDLGRVNALVFVPGLLLCYVMQERPLRHALGIGALLLASWLYPGVHGSTEYRTRSFFGVHRVTLDPTGKFLVLVHGNTVHGQQSLDPLHRREPLTYYHRTGPAGQTFAALQGENLRRVGIVGMGTASLCAYAEPGQDWTIYEIDPAVVHIARDSGLFTFFSECVNRCGKKPAVVVGDARLTLARTDEKYDLLVIDAFSSDAIPIHLLTREALKVYLDHLEDGGVLLFNISNRYLDLETVLGDLAANADPPLACIAQADQSINDSDKAAGKSPSHWVAIARTPDDLAKVRARGGWHTAQGRPGAAVWRDDYSNLLGVIKWRAEE
jgi:hypothetical protein